MSNGFIHSVRVPRLYKVTAKTVQTVEEKGASLKQLVYEENQHPNLRGYYALALTTIQHGAQLDELLLKTKLLFKEPRIDPWLARVLITELLWGKNCLHSEAKPIKTILSYEKCLREASENLELTDFKVRSHRNKVQKPRYVRINTLVKSVEDSLRSFTDDGWALLPKSQSYSTYLETLASLDEGTFVQDFHIPELVVFPPGTHFHNHPGYKSGALVLQDKASCLPAYLLQPASGSSVLDMCAAPGMKTTHLAAIMKNRGKIFAVERDNRRYKTLCEMVKMNAADCVTTINGDAMKLDQKQCSDIEYILVDPSCSGSGMVERISMGTANSECSLSRLRSLQSFQVLLLRHAMLSFPTVKRIVYSTCSIYPEENEMVVDEILGDIGDAYNLVPITNFIGQDWKNFSSTDYKCKDKCLYARSDVDMSNGFFVAVFERNFDVPLPEYKRKEYHRAISDRRLNAEATTVDDGNQIRERKKRKRSKLNDVSDDTSKVVKMDSFGDEKYESTIKNMEEESTGDKKRGSKRIKTECESDGDEMPDAAKPLEKKKKKNRDVQVEPIERDQHLRVDTQIDDNEASVTQRKKKKKKKKKKDKLPEPEIIEQINGTAETLEVEGQIIKKNKKKRPHTEILEDISVSSKSPPSEEPKNKERKKHTQVNVLNIDLMVECSDDQKKKKKKKKKKKYKDITET